MDALLEQIEMFEALVTDFMDADPRPEDPDNSFEEGLERLIQLRRQLNESIMQN